MSIESSATTSTTRRIVGLAPADGWWFVRAIHKDDGETMYLRERVVAWASVQNEDGSALAEAMLASERGELVFVSSVYPHRKHESDELWHDGQTRCCCEVRDRHSPLVDDDVYWCRRCGAEIETS